MEGSVYLGFEAFPERSGGVPEAANPGHLGGLPGVGGFVELMEVETNPVENRVWFGYAPERLGGSVEVDGVSVGLDHVSRHVAAPPACVLYCPQSLCSLSIRKLVAMDAFDLVLVL